MKFKKQLIETAGYIDSDYGCHQGKVDVARVANNKKDVAKAFSTYKNACNGTEQNDNAPALDADELGNKCFDVSQVTTFWRIKKLCI